MYIHVYIVFDDVCGTPLQHTTVCEFSDKTCFKSCPPIANRQNASKASARALQIFGIMSIRSLEMTWSHVQLYEAASGVASLLNSQLPPLYWVCGCDVVVSWS